MQSMFHDIQIMSIGTAAVIETVLLLAMLERRNGRYVPFWMLLLTAGAWMWHSGTFLYMLLAETRGGWAMQLRWVLMTVMATGLLLMPSAVLHGILRLWREGLRPGKRGHPLYILVYLPLAMLVPIAFRLHADPSGPFLQVLSPFVVPYIVWSGIANTISAIGSVRLRGSIDLPRAKFFFAGLSATLLGTTVLTAAALLVGVKAWPNVAPGLILTVTLLPVLPALLFAYFVIRYRFLPLVLERTLVYGAIVVGLLLVHRVVLRDVQTAVIDRYHVDFVILEWTAGIALILAYPPLRQRIAESLHYLMGSRVRQVREQMRRLSVQMSEWAGQPPSEILDRFAAALVEALQVEYVAGWAFNASGQLVLQAGETGRLEEARAAALLRTLHSARLHSCTWSDAPSRHALTLLQEAGASTAVLIERQEVRGLVLIGSRGWHQQLGEEELNSLLLLVDQLASTIQNSLLQTERLAAERRALQNEKLSTLGLLAGSIAHEVKNPLSSIKTIATVLAEQLASDVEHSEDLRLILGEIDRLAVTTSQLLEFARPASGGTQQGHVQGVIEWTLRVMRHMAVQRDVKIDLQLGADLPPVTADENTLREIFFNLLSNSIDAAGPGGQVQVACHRENGCVVAEVRDDGPGIPPAIQDRLFEPFFTTKETGTGLGLYVVGRRVRELGGEIHCTSAQGQGTSFILKFPCQPL